MQQLLSFHFIVELLTTVPFVFTVSMGCHLAVESYRWVLDLDNYCTQGKRSW